MAMKGLSYPKTSWAFQERAVASSKLNLWDDRIEAALELVEFLLAEAWGGGSGVVRKATSDDLAVKATTPLGFSVMVHPDLLLALERVRRDLIAMAGEDVWVIIKDGVRTEADLQKLGARLGWTGEGGAVSRDSMHLAKYGGIAVDAVAIVAKSRHPVPQTTLGEICRRHFDFVKDNYANGHVHADLRGHL